MSNWLDTMFGGSTAVGTWIALALVALLILWIVFRFYKSMRSGGIITGGRNRAPRLAVIDAAAVDAQRRLVLVRRDNVEHLILIGGPSDIVVEQGIQTDEHERALSARQMRMEPVPQPVKREPAPQVPSIQPVAPAPTPTTVQAPTTAQAPTPSVEPQFSEPVVSAPRRHTVAVTPPETAKPKPSAPVQPGLPRANAVVSPKVQPEPRLTEVHAPRVEPVQSATTPLEETLEQEMGRLLDDLSIEDMQKR